MVQIDSYDRLLQVESLQDIEGQWVVVLTRPKSSLRHIRLQFVRQFPPQLGDIALTAHILDQQGIGPD